VSTALFYLFSSNVVLAQLSVDNSSEKALATLGISSPVTYKISDKGLYNITIKSAESSPSSGLNFEIVFLNASSSSFSASPANASSTVTQKITVPAIVENVIPVESFDIRILSIDGKELSKKINEIPRGGRILENLKLNNYIGNISINIDNIVPHASVADILKKQMKLSSNQSDLRDSVHLEEQVVKS
jgi:hypothetical protein